jgi:hypothetical protein
MVYLGDSSKNIFMRCYIGPNYITSTNSGTYNYHIPCTLKDISKLYEGTYCVEIVKKLVGDITSESFCSDSYTFKITKSNNIPSLTVTKFSDEQIGCIKPGATITLLAIVKNAKSVSQSYTNVGIVMSDTEFVRNDINLNCKIEGQKKVNEYDKITCLIPNYISDGLYSISYSSDSLDNSKCPSFLINEFNSLNFKGNLQKLRIYHISDYVNIESLLTNITFENPSKIPGLFNLTFSLEYFKNLNYITFNNFKNKDLGLVLIDKNNRSNIVNTKCDFIKSKDIVNEFYLICTPENFEKNTKYYLYILNDITIGYNTSQVLCEIGSSKTYN